MFDRLAVAAVVVVLAIGTLTVGASLVLKPNEPAAGACPATLNEADAIDTSMPGLSQTQRAWGITGGTPARVGSGPIAAFASKGTDAPLSVITIDPNSAARCRLVRMVADHPLRVHHVTSYLDWSPSGDALAIGLEGHAQEDGPGYVDTHVLIWTPTKLFRVWSGAGQAPRFEWAPDGRSIAVWLAGGESEPPVVVLHADGSPDQTFGVRPSPNGLKWSPDGTRWLVVEWSGFGTDATNAVAVVDVADGRVTPIELGIAHLNVVCWLDDQRVLLVESAPVGQVRYLDVPVAAPQTYSVVPFPEEVVNGFYLTLSPDRQRAAYSVTEEGSVAVADLTVPAGPPLHLPLIETGFLAEFAWSPDGSFVLLASWTGVWIVNADGAAPRQVAVDASPIGDPWQPVPVR